MNKLLNYARELRRESTVVEKKLWGYLRSRRLKGFKFRRQYCIGKYIVDFVCFKRRLIIEIDGSQHMQQKDYDEERTVYLQSKRFKVIRFWNNEINLEFSAVMERIYKELFDGVSE